eukprot:734368-Rhodomonas_salina.1
MTEAAATANCAGDHRFVSTAGCGTNTQSVGGSLSVSTTGDGEHNSRRHHCKECVELAIHEHNELHSHCKYPGCWRSASTTDCGANATSAENHRYVSATGDGCEDGTSQPETSQGASAENTSVGMRVAVFFLDGVLYPGEGAGHHRCCCCFYSLWLTAPTWMGSAASSTSGVMG